MDLDYPLSHDWPYKLNLMLARLLKFYRDRFGKQKHRFGLFIHPKDDLLQRLSFLVVLFLVASISGPKPPLADVSDAAVQLPQS